MYKVLLGDEDIVIHDRFPVPGLKEKIGKIKPNK